MRRFEGYMRGVNLGGWLSQADETTKEHYDTFITEADIKDIAAMGLDHVRLPVDYTMIETEDGEMIEVCLGDLHHVGSIAVEIETLDPFFVNGILIPDMCSYHALFNFDPAVLET